MFSLRRQSVFSVLGLLWLLQFCDLNRAEDSIDLTYPPTSKTGDLTFDAGDNIHIQWTSTYPVITVQIWQGPDDEGTKSFQDVLSECNEPLPSADQVLTAI